MVHYLPAARVKAAATVNQNQRKKRGKDMANMLGHADKRTQQQRHDDAITGKEDLRPTALNNESNMVGTGPANNVEDERAVGTTPAPKDHDKKKGPGKYKPGNPGPGAQ